MILLKAAPLRSASIALAVALLAGCDGADESGATAAALALAAPLLLDSTGKAIFVIEPSGGGNQASLRETLLQRLVPQLATDARIERLVVSVPFDEEDPNPAVSSVVEAYGEPGDLRALTTEVEASLGDRARLNAYLVNERLPRRHEQVWPDGIPSPGIRMIALMIRNPELSPEEFDAYWRDEHTPIALGHTVAVLNYSQNTVLERLTDASDPIDGIVGEQFASPTYSRDRMLKHPIQFVRGILSARRFIDLEKARSTLMIETVIQSGAGTR
jgi:hypothetical protein